MHRLLEPDAAHDRVRARVHRQRVDALVPRVVAGKTGQPAIAATASATSCRHRGRRLDRLQAQHRRRAGAPARLSASTRRCRSAGERAATCRSASSSPAITSARRTCGIVGDLAGEARVGLGCVFGQRDEHEGLDTQPDLFGHDDGADGLDHSSPRGAGRHDRARRPGVAPDDRRSTDVVRVTSAILRRTPLDASTRHERRARAACAALGRSRGADDGDHRGTSGRLAGWSRSR